MKNKKRKELIKLCDGYISNIRNDLKHRFSNWTINLDAEEQHSVVVGLLARQVSLTVQVARAPLTWNEHIAPLILRSMIEVYINLEWISKDSLKRSIEFVNYGLGQLKLQIEHRKNQLIADGQSPETDPLIKVYEDWINKHKLKEFVEVNLGSWSGMNTRKMAEEAGCLDFYNYTYAPFSACVHSTWHHVERFNLIKTGNPLHRYFPIPIDPELGIDPEYLYLSAKYLNKTFRLFDENFLRKKTRGKSSFDKLISGLDKIHSSSQTNEL